MTPEQRRAAIDRATRDARRRLLRQRRLQIAVANNLLQSMASEIAHEVDRLAGAGGRVRPEQIGELKAFVETRMAHFRGEWQRSLSESLLIAATASATILQEAFGTPQPSASIVGNVIRQLRAFVAADGLQLSNRVWRLQRSTQKYLEDALFNGIMRGYSASQLASEMVANGVRTLPAEIRSAVNVNSARSLGAAVRSVLTEPGQANALFNLDRLFRTEMNRAFTEGFVASVGQHPDVAGVRFNLSPNHPRFDQCDMHAAANIYGMGNGVYPLGQHPYPAHPQTLSYLTAVFHDEITEADRNGRETLMAWLGRQRSALQDAALGGQAKGVAFRTGLLDAGEIFSPWRVVRQRLGL